MSYLIFERMDLMKKLLSLAAAVSMLTNMPFTFAKAEDSAAVPVKLDKAVYDQLIEYCFADENLDGIVTEEEFKKTVFGSFDLENISDLSFLKEMKKLECLDLRGGDFTDLSFLAEMDSIRELYLTGVPITDISFAKDMDLRRMHISDMDQITDQQKIDIIKWTDDVTVEKNFEAIVGGSPIGLFLGQDVNIEISGDSALNLRKSKDTACAVFGYKEGESAYTVTYNGKELHSGKITVVGSTPEDPPLTGKDPVSITSVVEKPGLEDFPEYILSYTGGNAVISDNKLYKYHHMDSFIMQYDDIVTAAQDAISIDGSSLYRNLVIKTDGSIYFGDNKVNHNGSGIVDIQNQCMISEDNKLYGLTYSDGEFSTRLITDDFKGFIENPNKFGTTVYKDNSGEMIDLEGNFHTGIMNVKSSFGNYYIDENDVLWKYSSKSAEIIAENVESVGYHYYLDSKSYNSDHTSYDDVYITFDGKAHLADNGKVVELKDNPTYYKDSDFFYLGLNIIRGDRMNVIKNYIITDDNVLTLNLLGQTKSITHVKRYLFNYINEEQDKVSVYFTRTDDTLWRYSTEDGKFAQVDLSSIGTEIKGDVNKDGNTDENDLICLNDFLLCKTKSLAGSGDINEDGKINSFDIAALRNIIAENKNR